jgi:RecB family exonuclease
MLDLKEIKLEVFDQWGFVDRLMIRGSKAHLIDYKFGGRGIFDFTKLNPGSA